MYDVIVKEPLMGEVLSHHNIIGCMMINIWNYDIGPGFVFHTASFTILHMLGNLILNIVIYLGSLIHIVK